MFRPMAALQESSDFGSFKQLLDITLAAHERVTAANQDFASEFNALRAHLRHCEALETGPPPCLDEADENIVEFDSVGKVITEATPAAEPCSLIEDNLLRAWHPQRVATSSTRRTSSSHSLNGGLADCSEVSQVLTNWRAVQDDFGQSEMTSQGRFAVMPDSILRTSWDMASVAVLCYDAVMIPLSVFHIGFKGHFVWMQVLISLFWTCDIGLSFISGYYEVSKVELRLSKIAHRYIRRTFMLDVFLVSIDWVFMVADSLDSGAARMLRMGRLFGSVKALRLLRLMRIVKLPGAIEQVVVAVNSKVFSTALFFFKALALIAVVNHFIACIWYAISITHRQEHGQPAWVDNLLDIEDRDDLYLYATSLHWSVTQFTPASMEVQPRNTTERFFAICVIVSALVVFSSLVSSITSAMTQLRMYYDHKYEQEEKIRRYVIEKRISHELAARIAVFIRQYNVLAKRKVHAQDVAVFSALPTPMKLQLHLEAHGPILAMHSFFYQVREYDARGLLSICNRTIVELPVDIGHELFVQDEDAVEAYFFLHGHAEYLLDGNVESFDADVRRFVFCEAALWIRFQHPGRVFCRTASEFLAMSSTSLCSVVPLRPELHRACCAYAAAFRGALRERRPLVDQYDLGLRSFDQAQILAQTAFEGAFEFSSSLSVRSESSRRIFGKRGSNQNRGSAAAPANLAQVAPSRHGPRNATSIW